MNADIFAGFERDDHFCCIPGETNPSISAHIRLITALRLVEDHPKRDTWITKAVQALRNADDNGNFWWDKWHISPYYVNSNAVYALQGVADDLAVSRLKWILKTQNDDGGWGYFGQSTPEETAYCLEALLFWDRHIDSLDQSRIDEATQFLSQYLDAPNYTPLWIGKSLYSPHNVVSAAISSVLFSCAIEGEYHE